MFLTIVTEVQPLRISHNLEENICRLFHVLAQFLLYTSETEVDCYNQKMNVRVALLLAW